MKKNRIQLMSWNVENLFLPESGGPRCDYTADEGWTRERYLGKIDRLCKIILKVIDFKAPYIISLVEVENPEVVNDLLMRLPKNVGIATAKDVKFNYYDCIIIYNKDYFKVSDCQYPSTFERFNKGDVVKVDFESLKDDFSLTVFGLHLKARPSSQHFTEMYRQAVCDNLQQNIWKMHGGFELAEKIKKIKDDGYLLPTSYPKYPNVVIMGDFNDEPFSSGMLEYLMASYDKKLVKEQKDIKKLRMYNCSWEGLSLERPGSCYYKRGKHSEWSMLDQIIISPALLDQENDLLYEAKSFKVIQHLTSNTDKIPHRICVKDEDYNTVWQDDGYSDHYPVTINLVMNKK